jgi:bifunctional DNase/RNase
MDKIQLEVLGLSYSQSQAGAYALILSDVQTGYRIPIIIGSAEAQSIAIELEKLKPPRPLTHDLFFNFATAFNIKLRQVEINKLEEGIFYSILVFYDGKNTVRMDARTSDAVALALRFNAPIYTTQEIIDKAGIIFESNKNQEQKKSQQKKSSENDIKLKSVAELEALLQEYIDKEEYEKASVIRGELKRRNKK